MKALVKLIFKIGLIAGVSALVLTYIAGIYPVHGNWMYPMVKDGDLVITLKTGNYNAGDVVTYKIDDTRYFSRIVGIEGSTIYMDEDSFVLNGGTPMEEIFYETISERGTIDVTVFAGEFFVLNDYRDDENDSRTFGCISENDLDGRVIFLFRRRGL